MSEIAAAVRTLRDPANGDNLYLASRNVPGVNAIDVAGIDPVSLVGSDKVVMTVDAIKKIEEWLG